MRPDAPYDPAVEPVEEYADVGTLVVLAPTPQKRIQLRNQLLRHQRYTTSSAGTHLIHEPPDGLLTRICIQRAGRCATSDFARSELKSPPPFNLVTEKLKSIAD